MSNSNGIVTKGDFVHRFRRLVNLLSQTSNSSTQTGFEKDFELLTKFDAQIQRDDATFASSNHHSNRSKNRYPDVLPNEPTICKISGVDESKRYFNGNFVCPPGNFTNFICCQAPLSNTIGDFWNVVWYYGVKVIVMLCSVTENGRSKSERYWPGLLSETITSSYFEITLVNESLRTDYVVREFFVVNKMNGEGKQIIHLHYTGWPDFGVPSNPDTVLEMFRTCVKISPSMDEDAPPILVHCSAGIGRTGTFVAVATALFHFMNGQEFDVFSIVKNLKQQRCGMIQRVEQYRFVYTAILSEMERLISQHYSIAPGAESESFEKYPTLQLPSTRSTGP